MSDMTLFDDDSRRILMRRADVVVTCTHL